MAPRLKVYESDLDGVHQWVVAAPSQAAALKAWDAPGTLFSSGRAGVSEDATARRAALAAPGEPLRRLKGSKGAFSKVSPEGGLEGWKAAARAVKAKPGAPPPKVDTRKAAAVKKAREALEAFETDRRAGRQGLEAALDAAREAVTAFDRETEFQTRRLEADVAAERQR